MTSNQQQPQGDDVQIEIERLRRMLAMPDKQHITDILKRRIYALTHEVPYANPFNSVDECLFDIWKGSIPTGQ